jgi:phosphoserine phosphatase RsbU/P
VLPRLGRRYNAGLMATPARPVPGGTAAPAPAPRQPRRLASIAATSFRDACAEPGLSLTEIARAVDLSVTRAAGQEDFVTAVFAELDPRGWLQLVVCGHPPPLRLSAGGELAPLAPKSFATPLGLHPDLHLSTFSVRTGDRLVFFTDGLLEARDRAGRLFRLDQQIEALRRPDLQAAADELLDRLRTHTRRRLDDDVAVLLADLTVTDTELRPAAPGRRPAAAEPRLTRVAAEAVTIIS